MMIFYFLFFWYAGRDLIYLTTSAAIHMFEAIWKYSAGIMKEWEIRRGEFIILPCLFCACVTFWFVQSFVGFCEVDVFSMTDGLNAHWNRCNISITQKSCLPEQRDLKINTAPSTKNSQKDCIYTHTKPMKKGILQLFSFLLSLKRAIKYIKTYLQCVGFFGQKTKNKTKRCDKLFSCSSGIYKVMCPCFLSA